MATPPSWRPDVLGEADLVEEVARVASLTKLKGVPMARETTGVPKAILTPMQIREKTARRTIAGLGYNDCVTYSFIDAKAAVMFGGGDEAVLLFGQLAIGHVTDGHVTLPLFGGVLNLLLTLPFCAVPRTSIVRTASG